MQKTFTEIVFWWRRSLQKGMFWWRCSLQKGVFWWSCLYISVFWAEAFFTKSIVCCKALLRKRCILVKAHFVYKVYFGGCAIHSNYNYLCERWILLKTLYINMNAHFSTDTNVIKTQIIIVSRLLTLYLWLPVMHRCLMVWPTFCGTIYSWRHVASYHWFVVHPPHHRSVACPYEVRPGARTTVALVTDCPPTRRPLGPVGLDPDWLDPVHRSRTVGELVPRSYGRYPTVVQMVDLLLLLVHLVTK